MPWSSSVRPCASTQSSGWPSPRPAGIPGSCGCTRFVEVEQRGNVCCCSGRKEASIIDGLNVCSSVFPSRSLCEQHSSSQTRIGLRTSLTCCDADFCCVVAMLTHADALSPRSEALTLSYVSQLYCPEVGWGGGEWECAVRWLATAPRGRARSRAPRHLGLRVRATKDKHQGTPRGGELREQSVEKCSS